MPRVLVLLAAGFEEIETATLVDVLRRAEVEVVLAGLDGEGPCRGSRGIVFVPDAAFEAVEAGPWELVALPGGMGGTQRMMAHEGLRRLLQARIAAAQPVAAICAAPLVLQAAEALPAGRFTSHPGVAHLLRVEGRLDDVVVDAGAVITGQSAGSAMPFALHLVRRLCGEEAVGKVVEGLQLKDGPTAFV